VVPENLLQNHKFRKTRFARIPDYKNTMVDDLLPWRWTR